MVAMPTPSSPTKPALSLAAVLWPCALYFGCAFAMNMLTKQLLATHRWSALFALGAVQNAFTTVSVGALLTARRLLCGAESTASSSSSKPRATTKAARLAYVLRVLVPLVALHVGNMLLGFAAMRVVNMPITVGSVIAGGTDSTADPAGYALVLLQNVCSALSLTFSKESALSPVELVLLNSAAGSVICALLALRFEVDAVLAFPRLSDPHFLATLAVMCCVCVLYQFSIVLCTLRNSALATSVTGNVKDLASTACGFLFFTDAPVRASNLAGVVLSLVGAYSFSYLKYLAFTQQAAQVLAAATKVDAMKARKAE
ncbi:hypothetical protein PybrP1_011544 [[Pythium] brassicae (nom. inval.)]|nr:hypothetical protein PybrP1_011544 [[Pythium] brassicae (nom. inval.)]